MKKKILTLTIIIACAAMIALFCGTGYASVSGTCVNCHTMHNSEAGSTVLTTAQGALIRGTCEGCHTASESSAPKVAGGLYVKPENLLTSYLAGGYFKTADGDAHEGISHSLGDIAVPVGYTTDVSSNADWYIGDTGGGLTCAGSAGCHGIETTTDQSAAISGGHHGNNTTLGYRMLCVGNLLVDGSGASDYEYALLDVPASATDDDPHNLYAATDAAGKASISKLCAKCHGDFHATTEGAAWTRHPTDVQITTSWEIQTITNYDHEDWIYNPAGTIQAVAPATDNLYVTCLSCHRAHGTDYPDLLRFVYADQCADGGGTTGCLGCHDKQR